MQGGGDRKPFVAADAVEHVGTLFKQLMRTAAPKRSKSIHPQGGCAAVHDTYGEFLWLCVIAAHFLFCSNTPNLTWPLGYD